MSRPIAPPIPAPATVAAFLRWLEKASPRHLAGVVWFRLPLAGDQRAWTPATWRAVVTHRETAVRLTGELQPGDRPGQQVVVLHNAGAMDGTLPAALIVKAPCRGMAGRNGYVLEREGDDSVFLRSQPALLRAGGEVIVRVGVVHLVQAPQGRDRVEHHVLQPDREVHGDHGEQQRQRFRQGQVVEQAPAALGGKSGEADGGEREEQAQ